MRESLDCFFQDFAIDVACSQKNKTFKAIFDSPVTTGNLGHYQTDVMFPKITCKTQDASIINLHDTIIINNKTYIVISNESDGTGLSELRLE